MKAPDQFVIVDDDTSNNFLCQRVIHVLFPKSTIRLFTHPEIALKIIGEEYPGGSKKKSIVLFLDINMPHLDGWAFLEKFGKLGKQIQEQFLIYLLSSSIDPLDRERATSYANVTGFLSKPLIVKELRLLFSEDRKT